MFLVGSSALVSGQMNWTAAAEANRLRIMHLTAASKYGVIGSAVFITADD